MKVLVTGSSGLIGSEAVVHFAGRGHRVVGLDNNLRRHFFGADGDGNKCQHADERGDKEALLMCGFHAL